MTIVCEVQHCSVFHCLVLFYWGKFLFVKIFMIFHSDLLGIVGFIHNLFFISALSLFKVIDFNFTNQAAN